ncbi:TAXI family TRAP transporter solute-binding subunit [Martelella soudanensis]|uniref:hypothetical protein n=1 Tax=unclassified Martelella TaxID=2629616 RepID=UPI0015DDC5C5|nr:MULTISPECIES: hypothetical protein [unclassified Martelella]
MKLTLYSPAPPMTRLHELNLAFGALLAEAGFENEVVALALPDAINRPAAMSAEERRFRLPIVTVADFLPAINATGPDWHGYDRPCPDLKLAASLYDVAFGITAASALIEWPEDLAGKRIFAPPRPSSVRLLTELLVEKGYGLSASAELFDSTPLDIGPAIGRGALKATSWNITTLENGKAEPMLRIMNARFLAVDEEARGRINDGLHFEIGGCSVSGVPLLAFRQGIAVWDDTPDDIAAAIVDVLSGQNEGPFFSKYEDLSAWPGLRDEHRHRALLAVRDGFR